MPALSSARTAIACTPHGGASVELAAKILHKDPKVTAVIVEAVDPADWFAGGKSLAEQELASFWLDIPDRRRHQQQGRERGICRSRIQPHGRTAGAVARRELRPRQRRARRHRSRKVPLPEVWSGCRLRQAQF